MTTNKKFYKLSEFISSRGDRVWHVNEESATHAEFAKFRSKSLIRTHFQIETVEYDHIIIRESGHYFDSFTPQDDLR